MVLVLVLETILHRAPGVVPAPGLVPYPGLVPPGNTHPSILHSVLPVPTPPGNTPTKTSKPNIHY